MSAHHDTPRPIDSVKFLTPGTIFLLLMMAAGASFGIWRYICGLHAATNLTITFPWGIWKAMNVAAVAAAGSSGFTLTFIVHVLHKEKYHMLMRPGLVVGMFCYTFVGIALLVDLGKYYDLWHPMMPSMWQPNSALFEVAMCVMCYLTVLYMEFAPVFFERFIGKVNLPGPLASFNKIIDSLMRLGNSILGKILSVFMVLGIVLCCLHQSTLGTIMVIVQPKLHPLWYSPILPQLFLLSAIAIGLAAAVAVSLWSSLAFKTKYEMEALTPFSRSLPVFIGIYMLVRLLDIAMRDQLGAMFNFHDPRAVIFLIEYFIGCGIPLVMTLLPAVRKSPGLLLTASIWLIIAISFNRVNSYITAYMPFNRIGHYTPSVAEVVICLAQVAAMIFLYRTVCFIFPIISQPPKQQKA